MSKVIPLPDRTQRFFARVDARLPTLSPEGERLFLIQLIAGWNEQPNVFTDAQARVGFPPLRRVERYHRRPDHERSGSAGGSVVAVDVGL
jgi:hypothetical protein